MDPFLRKANDEEALEEAHQAASRFIGAARPEGHVVEPKQSSEAEHTSHSHGTCAHDCAFTRKSPFVAKFADQKRIMLQHWPTVIGDVGRTCA